MHHAMVHVHVSPLRAAQVVCQRQNPALSAAGRPLTSSGVGLLTRSDDNSSSTWQRSQPQPQTEHSGGGNGRRPRNRLGYSGNGGQEDSDGLRLPWNPLFGLAAGIAARSRADPAFLLKLGCSCSADALVVLAVNMACRGARFWPDLEAVLSQCCVSVLCDAALMYLAAPTAHTRRGLLRPGLPAHAFQAAAPGQAGFTLSQRAACVLLRAGQYAAMGFVMGCLGSDLAQAAASFRARGHEHAEERHVQHCIVRTGLGWLYFMGLSSTARYSVLHAAEDVVSARLPRPWSTGLAAGVRLCNMAIGARAWLTCARALQLERMPPDRHQQLQGAAC